MYFSFFENIFFAFLRAFGKQPEAKAKRRKDAQRPGVIIREEVAEGVQRLQPRDVPFPFTRIQDYEVSTSQLEK